MKKTLFAALLATTSLCAFAEADSTRTEYVFNPHLYVQAQVGAQYTVGEVCFGSLVSPNIQIAAGYNFTKIIGARFSINAWQSKAGSSIINPDLQSYTNYKWKWYYVAPSVDVTFNLSNLIAGVNPKRLVDVTAFIGGGLNIAWSNKGAVTVNNAINAMYPSTTGSQDYLRYLWDGTKVRGVGRAGIAADFKVAKNWTVGAEVNANVTGDGYNSKKASCGDWYFNALIGVKYAFGKTYTEKKTPLPQPQIIYKDRIVEKVINNPSTASVGAKAKALAPDPLRKDVFFTIGGAKLVGSEAQKVNDVAQYLKKYPTSKITLTGYADKATGSAKVNMALSAKRANVVKDVLVNKYGIEANRITTEAKGSTVQPYDIEVLNRVTICITK